MEDPREPQKRTWVTQATTRFKQQNPEPDRIVGRDMSENMESTSAASSVPRIKTSANTAPITGRKEETTVMDPELDKRIKNLQTIMETNQKAIKDELSLLRNYLAKDKRNTEEEIYKLRCDNQYNERVLKDFNAVKDSAKKYKQLFWGLTGSLAGLLTIFLAAKAFIF